MEYYEIIVIIIGVLGIVMGAGWWNPFKKSKKEVNPTFKAVSINYAEGGFRATLTNLINEHRDSIQVHKLTPDYNVTEYADNRCAEMVKAKAASHIGFDSEPVLLMEYGGDYVGENVGFGYAKATGFMKAFLNSPGHRRLIEDRRYDYLGVGVLKNEQGRRYCCLMFVGEVNIN